MNISLVIQSGLGIADSSSITDGSHVDPNDIHNYARKDMLFSCGIFGLYGPYPVNINSVNGTVVNMTFINPIDSKKCEAHEGLTNYWTKINDCTWEWDYNDGWTTWLE